MFESLQLDSTRHRYVSWVARLVTFILRYVINPSSRTLPLNLTHQQTSLAVTLNGLLEGSLTSPDEISAAQEAAGDLLDSLFFTQHESISEEVNKDPHMVFLALVHLDPETGNFSSPSVVAHDMAAYLYGFRPLTIRHILNHNISLGLPNHNNLFFE